jgi:tetratricopeptide (TPR) repeat protein
MNTRSESRSRRFRQVLYLVAVLAAFGVGHWIAQATVIETSLLENAENDNVIEKLGSIVDQFEIAQAADLLSPEDAEQAWRSVVEYWSDSGDGFRLGIAYARLAEFCLDRGEFDDALDLYRKQYDVVGDAEQRLKAEALAGQYDIYDLQGMEKERNQIGMKLWPHRSELEDGPFEGTVLKDLNELKERFETQAESGPS